MQHINVCQSKPQYTKTGVLQHTALWFDMARFDLGGSQVSINRLGSVTMAYVQGSPRLPL